MFRFARNFACATLVFSLVPMAALAQSGGETQRVNQQRPPATAPQPSQYQQRQIVTPALSPVPPAQEQVAAMPRRDHSALAAPADRNWVFRDPRLEP